MQPSQYCASMLYKDIEASSELGKFRRYTKLWSWILYSESAAINRQVEKCDASVAKARGLPSGAANATVTDFHANWQEIDPDLNSEVETLMNLVRKYSKDALLACSIMQLPEQSEVFAEHFSKYSNLFCNGTFSPTGEDETYYKQRPSHPDTFAPKSMERQDHLTEAFFRNKKTWIKKCEQMWRRLRRQKVEGDVESQIPESIDLDVIRSWMNILIATYAPLLFSISMALLHCIKSTLIQIVVLGILGLVLTSSVYLLVDNIKRTQLFAITSGYFAVLATFIGVTSNSILHN